MSAANDPQRAPQGFAADGNPPYGDDSGPAGAVGQESRLRIFDESSAVRGCQLLSDAVREACRLIWVEDAVWTEGGAAKLDAWVDRYGPLVGFDTKEGVDV